MTARDSLTPQLDPEEEERVPPKAQEVVVDKATGRVLRSGYCDFENDGSFKPETETILRQGEHYEEEFLPEEGLDRKEWLRGETGFSPGADKALPSAPPVVLTSADGSSWELVVDDSGRLTTRRL